MKILHVIARMNVGGTATYLYNLISGLEEAETETLLAVGHVPQNEREDYRLEELNYCRIENLSRAISPLNDFRARSEISRTIEKFSPDVIHTHTFKAGLLVRTLKTSVPLIHTFHGHHLYDPDYGRIEKKMINSIEKRLAKKNAKIITIGQRVGRELFEAGIGTRSQYLSISPGIECPKITDRYNILKYLRIDDGITVLWMGRLTHVKRPERVVEVARRFPKVNFVVAGDGELRDSIRMIAPDNVHLVGVRNSDEMWSIADIVLLTSDSEGMPLTLIEGQMAGVPAIATNVGSVEEIVLNGETGLITQVTVDDICEKLAVLINDSMLRSTMAKKAASRARKLFSIQQMTSAHIEVYQEALEKAKQ
jgi:glycosyltransferase involved in cell wall biosynthesis